MQVRYVERHRPPGGRFDYAQRAEHRRRAPAGSRCPSGAIGEGGGQASRRQRCHAGAQQREGERSRKHDREFRIAQRDRPRPMQQPAAHDGCGKQDKEQSDAAGGSGIRARRKHVRRRVGGIGTRLSNPVNRHPAGRLERLCRNSGTQRFAGRIGHSCCGGCMCRWPGSLHCRGGAAVAPHPHFSPPRSPHDHRCHQGHGRTLPSSSHLPRRGDLHRCSQADRRGQRARPACLFDAALACCKTLTVTLYARQRNYPLDSIEVAVEHDGSQERHGRYKLRTVLTLHGDLTDEQRADLLRVAGKCPVHKLMTEVEISIDTQLAERA
ncbi:conserved hypothetical protein [Ralstonia solanacearum Po82]|uniref:OsmC family protein n=1 Tax=Ralstonia solanacearum (strain Po82) TaxID=1031711 RepID=F6G5F6_RALS8|nr:conserved hypothetical protein [Ralstonia solanacearum Po82]